MSFFLISFWQELAGQELRGSMKSLTIRGFTSVFGVHPITTAKLFSRYLQDSQFEPVHLLWLLSFFKSYGTTVTSYLQFRCVDSKAFQETIWDLVSFLDNCLDEVMINFFFSSMFN